MSFSLCRTGEGENCFDASVSGMVNSVPDQGENSACICHLLQIFANII